MQVIIDRQKWERGTGDGYLLNPCNGKMCAMGFVALAAGIDAKEIEGRGIIPVEIGQDKLPDVVDRTGSVEFEIEIANDDEELSEDEREEKIGNIAKQAGIDIEFIN